MRGAPSAGAGGSGTGRGRWQRGTVRHFLSFIPSSRRRWRWPLSEREPGAQLIVREEASCPANSTGQRCVCQSAPILTQGCQPAATRGRERQTCPHGGTAASVPAAQRQGTELKQCAVCWTSQRARFVGLGFLAFAFGVCRGICSFVQPAVSCKGCAGALLSPRRGAGQPLSSGLLLVLHLQDLHVFEAGCNVVPEVIFRVLQGWRAAGAPQTSLARGFPVLWLL